MPNPWEGAPCPGATSIASLGWHHCWREQGDGGAKTKGSCCCHLGQLSTFTVQHVHLHPCLNSINTPFCFTLDDSRALIGHEEIHQAAAWCGGRVPIASGSCRAAAPRLLNGWQLPQNSPNIIHLLQHGRSLCGAEGEPESPLPLLMNTTWALWLAELQGLGLGGARSQLFAGNRDGKSCFQPEELLGEPDCRT